MFSNEGIVDSFSIIFIIIIIININIINLLFYHRNVNSFLVYFILFFTSCMYGKRAPNGEMCNYSMYVCMYVCKCILGDVEMVNKAAL